jgi:predicted membrane protein
MRINTSNLFWGLLLIAVGVIFLLDNRGVVDAVYILRTYWPLVLIVLGLAMLLGSTRRKNVTVIGSPADVSASRGGAQQTRSGTRNIEQVYESNVFGDVHLAVTSDNFKGGSVSTVFGDMSIDLLNTNAADGEQELNISGVFGDVDIDIPPDVPISVSGSTLFGDIRVREERRSGIGQQLAYRSENYDTAARKLKIQFNQVFGDIKIR